jgi:hydroxymethylbilane synthase
MAVHSLKDVPTEIPKGIILTAVLQRDDPRDVVVSTSGEPLHRLPPGAVIGTSSPRRGALIKHRFPHLVVRPVRGNVPTRLQLVEEGKVDALILAHAGLERLSLTGRITEILPPDVMLPSATQGIIGIVCREDAVEIRQLLAPLNDPLTWQQAIAERSFLAILDGSCRTPIAAWAECAGENMTLHGLLSSLDGDKVFTARAVGRVHEAEQLGQQAADDILTAAGADFITALRAS